MTTTRDIARLAKVNDGLIHYYFGRKQNLYWAVLEQARRDSPLMESMRRTLRNGKNRDAVILELFQGILRYHEDNDTLFRLLLFTGLKDGDSFHGLSRRFFKIHLHTAYDLVADYIAKQIQAGNFRKVNPVIASQALFSLATYPYVIREFLGGKTARGYSPKVVGQTLAEFWLQAMQKSRRE